MSYTLARKLAHTISCRNRHTVSDIGNGLTSDDKVEIGTQTHDKHMYFKKS